VKKGAKKGTAKKGTKKLDAIGWREFVSFPEWGIRNLLAKIDTGARTSAIHAEQIEELPDGRLRFRVILDRKSGHFVWVEAPRARTSRVRPSTGTRQERHVVVARLRIGTHLYQAEISLVSRKEMMCRMLVGRAAPKRRFAVDPARSFLQSGKLGQKRKKRMLTKRLVWKRARSLANSLDSSGAERSAAEKRAKRPAAA
jgi:hypothetical protein